MYRREFNDQHAIEEAQQEDLGAGGSQCPGEMVDEIINFRDFLGEAKICKAVWQSMVLPSWHGA